MKNLTDNEIKQLSDEFESLNSIEEKLDFWSKKLGKPYYLNSHLQLNKFYINTNNEHEIYFINQFNLNEIQSKKIFFPNSSKNISEPLRNRFYLNYKFSTNKIKLLEKEIDNIDNCLNNYPMFRKHDLYVFINEEFKTSFNNAYFHGNYPNYYSMQYEFEVLIAINDGFELSEYRKEIEMELESQKDFNNKRERTTLNQQVLILHYLRVLNLLNKNIPIRQKQALFLSVILNQDSKNIKTLLERPDLIKDQIRSNKTNNYLNNIISLFDEIGLNEISQLVKNDKTKYGLE